jgi:hypothetical protein
MKSKAFIVLTALTSLTALSQTSNNPYSSYSRPDWKISTVECSGSLDGGPRKDPFSFRYDLGFFEAKKVAELDGYVLHIAQDSGGVSPYFVIKKGGKLELSLSLEEGFNRFRGVFAGDRGDKNHSRISIRDLNCSVARFRKDNSEKGIEKDNSDPATKPSKSQVNIM